MPMPTPGKAIAEYVASYERIIDVAELREFVDAKFGTAMLNEESIEEVLFSLQNLNAFAIHALDTEPPDNDLGGVLRVAAGNDFAGVGGTARKIRRFEKWADKAETPLEKFELPTSAFIDLVQETIEEFKDRLST